MEILKPKTMECDKKISITLNITLRNNNKKNNNPLPIIAYAIYNGAVKCPDEKQSTSFLFHKKNAYLTDAFMN